MLLSAILFPLIASLTIFELVTALLFICAVSTASSAIFAFVTASLAILAEAIEPVPNLPVID